MINTLKYTRNTSLIERFKFFLPVKLLRFILTIKRGLLQIHVQTSENQIKELRLKGIDIIKLFTIIYHYRSNVMSSNETSS